MESCMSELSDSAIEIIRKRGWTKGNFVNNRGEVCAVGAVFTASSQCHNITRINAFSPEHEQAKALIVRMEEILQREGDCGYRPALTWWNDYVAKSVEDVILLIKKAGEEDGVG